jgi:L-malate glycosyltransferase
VKELTSTSRPRVLQVLYSFQLGGSEIFGLQLAKQLVELGVEVYCAAIESSPGPLLQRCQDYGVKPLDLQIPTGNILGRNGISMALTARLHELRPNAIHLQHFLGLNKLGIPARLAGIRRIVVTEHSILDVSQSRAGRVRAQLSWRLASKITVIHQSIKDYLCEDLGLPGERIEVIPIGIEVDRYHRHDRAACRVSLGIGSQLTFVFVGRLAAVKGVPGLIAAFLAVQSRNAPESRLIVVGDGQDRQTCQGLIVSHPLGYRVSLVGEQADPRPYLASADVFVMNSRSEGTPRALLEAMAMGLPGIGPAVGGLPDMLNGRGWLTTPGSQSSLEASIELILNNPEAVTKMAELCRQYVELNFDSKRIAERYREILVG